MFTDTRLVLTMLPLVGMGPGRSMVAFLTNQPAVPAEASYGGPAAATYMRQVKT